MECPVCYTDNSSCKLVCGHEFCKSCVKTWYYKCEEPSCPMCRRDMYFKGMNRIVKVWENERAIKKNEDAFSQAFDEIFFEDDEESFESETESDSDESDDSDSWETSSEQEYPVEPEVPEFTEENPFAFDPTMDYYTEFIMGEIKMLQKDYQKAMELGVDFEWYLDNIDYFLIVPSQTVVIYDDIFPHTKNLFVSNHKSMFRNNRSGKRVHGKSDTSVTILV